MQSLIMTSGLFTNVALWQTSAKIPKNHRQSCFVQR